MAYAELAVFNSVLPFWFHHSLLHHRHRFVSQILFNETVVFKSLKTILFPFKIVRYFCQSWRGGGGGGLPPLSPPPPPVVALVLSRFKFQIDRSWYTIPANYLAVLKHYTIQGYRVLALASKTPSPHLGFGGLISRGHTFSKCHGKRLKLMRS